MEALSTAFNDALPGDVHIVLLRELVAAPVDLGVSSRRDTRVRAILFAIPQELLRATNNATLFAIEPPTRLSDAYSGITADALTQLLQSQSGSLQELLGYSLAFGVYDNQLARRAVDSKSKPDVILTIVVPVLASIVVCGLLIGLLIYHR
jgi:hypothetical protein